MAFVVLLDVSPHARASAPAGAPTTTAAVEQAEAVLVEHYARLVRIAYLVLPPALGRHRRVLAAHSLVQRSLPRRTDGRGPGRARQRPHGGGAVYAHLLGRVLRGALAAGRHPGRPGWRGGLRWAPLLPQVWGLRLFPHCGGADELALDRQLSALSAPARAAFVLRGLERLTDGEVRRALVDAGADDADSALAEADGVRSPGAGDAAVLLDAAEFDPCSLRVRPPDLLRRRMRFKATLAAIAAALVCGTLFVLPGDGRGPHGAVAPGHAGSPVAAAALDPARLSRVAPVAWRSSTRTDFTVWPARGSLTGDPALLRRALSVWAGPESGVRVSATPGTPSGPPIGAPQLLFAGRVDRARVVVFHDGLRIVRYAEPSDGTARGAALDLARVDGADAASSGALVVGRGRGGVRYLTAPWVGRLSTRDLADPSGAPRPLRRDAQGVTDPVPSGGATGGCDSWAALELAYEGGARRLVADLGELVPARLTWGPPSAPVDVPDGAARAAWARTACLLPAVRSHGVRTVNSWAYARQALPEGDGSAAWLCTRADTWRGSGSQVLAQVQLPSSGGPAAASGVVAARAEDSPACGPRVPQVLAGVLWRSRAGRWYVLAAGTRQFASLSTTGGAVGSARGRLLAVPAKAGAQAELSGRLPDGSPVAALR
ncbi:hypothetical protein [Streptomyces sp. NPDC059176]|uniref:hypothetical protein n=1 Tax=unclassified Streptomyces TaxID=2593676 RepID=UPI0036916A0F